jgi:hypothetical protein
MSLDAARMNACATSRHRLSWEFVDLRSIETGQKAHFAFPARERGHFTPLKSRVRVVSPGASVLQTTPGGRYLSWSSQVFSDGFPQLRGSRFTAFAQLRRAF